MAQGVSRRRFLKGTAAGVGAGLLGPLLTATRVVAAPGKPAPSDEVRIGHIGLGGMGRSHLGTYCHNDRFPSVAVCDIDRELAAQAAARCKRKAQAYGDFRRLLDRDDIQAVVVATPDHWHAIPCVRACESGKDVYCEKPLSLTIRQSRAMADAARRYARVFQVGSQQRSSWTFRKAVQLCRAGCIGKISRVYVAVGGPSQECYLPGEPCPPHIDWEMWLGPAPWRPFNRNLHYGRWRPYRDYSGGSCTDWGAHHMDIALWGLGREFSGPIEVQYDVKTRRFIHKHPGGVTIEMCNVQANGVKFFGAEGIIECNRGHFRTWPDEIGKEELSPGHDPDPRQKNHRGNWMECMISRKRSIADVEIGHRTITACHLGNISYWLGGRKLHWDPDKEEILGDTEASGWLDRPMRAPWRL